METPNFPTYSYSQSSAVVIQMHWYPTCLVQNCNYPLSSPEGQQEVVGSNHHSSWGEHQWVSMQSGPSAILHPSGVAGSILSDSFPEGDCGNGT